jgi:hypothetical protein
MIMLCSDNIGIGLLVEVGPLASAPVPRIGSDPRGRRSEPHAYDTFRSSVHRMRCLM